MVPETTQQAAAEQSWPAAVHGVIPGLLSGQDRRWMGLPILLHSLPHHQGNIFYVASGTVHIFNMFAICNVLCIITAGIILIVRPYKPKYRVYHTFDVLMMLALAVFAITLMEVYVFIDARNFNSSPFVIMAGALSLTPLLYFIVRSIMYISTTIRVLVSRTLCV